MWDIGLITDALVIIGTDENPSETQRESTGTARRSDFENVVPHGALPIKIRATSLSRVLRRGSALGLPPHLGFHPGARQQWSSHPRSTQAHHVVHSPRPRLPSRPAAPTCMAPCSVANNALQEGYAAPLHMFFLLHLSPSRSLSSPKLIPRRFGPPLHRPLHTDHVTHTTHLHSFSARARGSPVLTQISQRIDPGYTGFNGMVQWCSILGLGLEHDWGRKNAQGCTRKRYSQ